MGQEIQQLVKRIDVFQQSSIRIRTDKVIYADPFDVPFPYRDADLILLTHDHYDYYSPRDLDKVRKNSTVFVVPEKLAERIQRSYGNENEVIVLRPGERATVDGVPVEAVAAYNRLKLFHPKAAGWVGYVLTVEGLRVYIAGDTDQTRENSQVRCDLALIPIGGKFTMNPRAAAEFINQIRPQAAIPTHYGSIVGTREDGDSFRRLVDSDIMVELKL